MLAGFCGGPPPPEHFVEQAPLLPGLNSPKEEWAAFLPLSRLPPLPARSFAYFCEPWIGVGVVSFLCLVLISGTTHYATGAEGQGLDPKTSSAVVGLVWTWAVIAALCTAYLVFGEAGVITRGLDTCYPIPEEVVGRLLRNIGLDQMGNVQGPYGYTYCIRCFVWRPPTGHHCSTCSRCVRDFDHHCGVFGRCIAGRGLGGNMGYFKVIIGAGNIGGLSAAVCLFLGLSRSGQIGHLVAMALGGYLGVVCIFWTVAFLFWQLSKLRHLRLRGPSHCLKRSAGWRRFPSEAGTGSDIDTSPVDPVIFGVHR
mmetsp:Transcript_45861/g.130942  ORF Transcript_45861/g.130942 Transcript_45861/m.130942 type:complete len:310 (-) Transcript_45861:55-984(-)